MIVLKLKSKVPRTAISSTLKTKMGYSRANLLDEQYLQAAGESPRAGIVDVEVQITQAS